MEAIPSAGAGPKPNGTVPGPAVLLATKLTAPALRPHLISRAALVQALWAGDGRKLTLLDAPAGWGKTTLLAQWIAPERERNEVAWLSLDLADNDPARFWTYVVTALQKARPGLDTRAVELIGVNAGLQQVVLPTLLNALASLDERILLILDDYHVVTNRAIHEEMAFFIELVPTNLSLVIATRSDPPLPLARLRAGGHLLEIRADDLRFAEGEASRMLNDALGLGLAAEGIKLLCQRTEGWAAGLYLAALSLEGRSDAGSFIRAFAGDNRHIVDYLSAEVLDSQPPAIRLFLLRTAVLERLSGPLCDAVLDTSASAATLEQIERDNLFLIPLDSSRHWYRYHHLFGGLLLRAVQVFKAGVVARAVDVAEQAAHADLGDVPLGRSAAYCVYGAALYWSGRTPDARAAFSLAVQLSNAAGNLLGRTYSLGYLALIAAERGQLAEADQLLHQAAEGDREASAGEHFVDMMPALAMAKVLDRQGATAQAADAADRAVVLSLRGGGNLEVASALLVRSEILRHLGDPEAARSSAVEASALLRDCPDPGLARELLAAAEDESPGSRSRPAGQGLAVPALPEQLTSKELEFLRLLQTPLSRREISARLYVSLNTVKTHQRGLYRKLGVTGRAEAIKRGRDLGLSRPAEAVKRARISASCRGGGGRPPHLTRGEAMGWAKTAHPAPGAR